MTKLEEKLWADDIDFITKLTKENKELQAKIDKAIEYIIGFKFGDGKGSDSYGEIYGEELMKLEEILKS